MSGSFVPAPLLQSAASALIRCDFQDSTPRKQTREAIIKLADKVIESVVPNSDGILVDELLFDTIIQTVTALEWDDLITDNFVQDFADAKSKFNIAKANFLKYAYAAMRNPTASSSTTQSLPTDSNLQPTPHNPQVDFQCCEKTNNLLAELLDINREILSCMNGTDSGSVAPY
eukprot:GHVP01028016.1.p1 GENE.GHVP01028016.1~~GHVP01028016.1.p1  ORF type:complete len:173 (+),score=17.11 GHVP01028016.1:38-556(+)